MHFEQKKGKKFHSLYKELFRTLVEGVFLTVFFNLADCDDQNPLKVDNTFQVMAYCTLGQAVGSIISELVITAFDKCSKKNHENALPLNNYLSKVGLRVLVPSTVTGFSWYGVSLISEQAAGITPHCQPVEYNVGRVISSCLVLGLIQGFIEMLTLGLSNKVYRKLYPRSQMSYTLFNASGNNYSSTASFRRQEHLLDSAQENVTNATSLQQAFNKLINYLYLFPWHEGIRVSTLEASSYGSQYIMLGASSEPQLLISTLWTVACIIPGVAIEHLILVLLMKKNKSNSTLTIEEVSDTDDNKENLSSVVVDSPPVMIAESIVAPMQSTVDNSSQVKVEYISFAV